MTSVVNLRDYPGRGMTRELPEGVVRVDRRSKYGNPYKIGEGANRYHAGYDRETVLRLYRKYLFQRLAREPDFLEPLRGKTLGCWCKPLACHADVIAEELDRSQK